MKHLDKEADVFRSLQDDVFAAHGSHFHEVAPGYTSCARAWWPMPTLSGTRRFTALIRGRVGWASPAGRSHEVIPGTSESSLASGLPGQRGYPGQASPIN